MRIFTDTFLRKHERAPGPRERSLAEDARSKLWLSIGLPAFLVPAYVDYFRNLLGLPKAELTWRLYDMLRERSESPDLKQRFEQLAHLPRGTFGREFWEYCNAKGVPLPGHPRALPVHSSVHDFVHLLSGYGITIWGEMLTTAFSLGFMFGPQARNYDPSRYKSLVPVRLLAELLPIPQLRRAVERGSAMSVDLFGDWDPWQVMELPLEEVKRRYNIQPE
jgi:ubiquinone biosynthesis protein Coq4